MSTTTKTTVRRLLLPGMICLLVLAFALASVAPALASTTVQEATPTPVAEEEMEEEATEEATEETSEEVIEEETADEAMEETMEEMEPELVTATAHADLVRPGRVLMSARGNHWILDSVPPLNGPNEEVNPLDGLLTSLISCGMYIYEAVAMEERIPLNHISATVTGSIDGRGLTGAAVSPRVRSFSVIMNVEGPSAEQAAMMAEAFSRRCPIYTTLARSAPIDVTNVVFGVAQDPMTTEADPIVDYDEADELELELGAPTARGHLVETGRALVSARGNHWILDSVPPIKGPNEEVNPLDEFIGALPACGIMIYEAVAAENDIALNAINASVEADLDPRGVAGANVNPRIRAFRVTMNVDGPTEEEAAMMADEFSTRCPIYTTYERSAPIEVTNEMMGSEQSAGANVAPTVTFTAANSAYDGPDSIPGGLTRIEFTNTDEKDHSLWLVKRDEGKTFDDVLGIFAALGTDPDFPEWAVWYGGVSAGPGETRAYTIDLAPGAYSIFSFSADVDGVPEMFKGFSADLTVTEAEGNEATPPSADLRTEMIDFSYISDGAPVAGPAIVEVTNTGTDPHEALVYKLDEGVSVQDAMEFMMAGEDADGPPPFTAVGSMAPMSTGLTAWYELEFESGDYGLFCFIPSPANEGTPHFMLGMIAQVTVE